jgi:phosphatidylserine decarboxylase
MKTGIHKEGRKILAILGLVLLVLIAAWYLFINLHLAWIVVPALVFYLLILQFFRHPQRLISVFDDRIIYAPADGKVVSIEEVQEDEYFNQPRLMVSIFMSPLNVHVNRIPTAGTVKYFKYHPGKYLAAWHPKSSTENERTTMVIENAYSEVLVRQIAGAVARRIRWYIEPGQKVVQGQEYGFIKFGSRVDLFLPIDSEVLVDINDMVKGNLTQIAHLPDHG